MSTTQELNTGSTARHGARTGASMAVASMLAVQLGIATAVGLFDQVGPLGAAWLRLAWAGLIMLVVLRPRPSTFTRASFGVSRSDRPPPSRDDTAKS